MHRRVLLKLLLFWICTGSLYAQDLSGIAIHGFITQGFLFSSHNNYLTMQSSAGSLQWTDGAISVSDSVTDNLRGGIQLHMYQLGQLGGPNIHVDWASADYRATDWFGIRAGKVKTVVGLFNDSQDVDAIFVWALLPQCSYPIDNQGFYLAHLGGDIYGAFPLGNRFGKLRYDGFVGEVSLDPNGGYQEDFEDGGITFPDPPGGRTYGGDLRWDTPLTGLTLGLSEDVESINGTAPGVSLRLAPFQIATQYAQFAKGRFYFAGQYDRAPFVDVITSAEGVFTLPFDFHSWFAMGTYRVGKNLHVGSYYSHYVNKAMNTALSANYSKDFVVSGRYDFNSYFYGKIEGHFLHGTGLGYYDSTNPNGLRPNANMLAAKVGFSF